MTRDIELAVRADDTEVQYALGRVSRAIAGVRARDRWRRTHCIATLAQTGPGVAHNAFTEPREPRPVVWSKDAYEAIHPLTGPGSRSSSRVESGT